MVILGDGLSTIQRTHFSGQGFGFLIFLVDVSALPCLGIVQVGHGGDTRHPTHSS